MKIGGSKTYWILQGCGWGLYLVSGLVIARLYPLYDPTKATIFQFIACAVLIALSHGIRYVLHHFRWLQLPWTSLLFRMFLLNLACAVVVNLFNSVVMYYGLNMFENLNFSFGALAIYIMQTFVVFTLWSSIYIAVYFFRNYKQQEIEKWKLQASLKDAELIALKSQINPHFIFNSLNNIRSLV